MSSSWISLVLPSFNKRLLSLHQDVTADFLSIGSMNFVRDAAEEGGVISKLDNGVEAVCGNTVMNVQGEEQWAEDTLLCSA